MAAVAGAGLWARAQWVAGAAPGAGQLLRTDRNDLRTGDPWYTAGAPYRVYRPQRPFSGTTTVRVTPADDGSWYVATGYRLVLDPADRVAVKLRGDVSAFRYVLPNLPGGYAAAHALGPALPPGSCVVTQERPGADVVVTASRRARLWPDTLKTLDYRLGQDPTGTYRSATFRGRPPRWTFQADVPSGWKLDVAGQPTRQTGREITADLAARDGVTRVRLVPPIGSGPRSAAPGATAEALALATVGGLAATGALLARAGFLTALPTATHRRWGAAFAGSALVTALAAAAVLAAAFAEARAGDSGWNWISWSTGGTVSAPAPYVAGQQAVLALFWFVLPVAVLAVLLRLAGGRPPGARELAGAALAGPALLGVESAVAAFAPWSLLAESVAAGAAAGVWGLLRSGVLGPAGRRWAVTCAAVTLALVSGLSALSLLPGPGARWLPGADTTWTAAAWPAALAVAAPWTIVVLRTVRALHGAAPRKAAASWPLGVVLAALTLPWNGSVDRYPQSIGVLAWLTNLLPGTADITDVTTLALPWQTAWVGAVVCLVCWLRLQGGRPRQWPRGARPACLALVWLTATAPVVGAVDSRVGHHYAPLVAVLGCLAPLWLVPARREAGARRLHAVSRAAHVRLTQTLLRTQLLARSRHRFFRDSLMSLADGSLAPSAWDARWHSLSETSPSQRADPAGRLRRLKNTALGTSGGFPPWRNGLACATAAALLSLPWTVSEFWSSGVFASLPQTLTAAGGAPGLWISAGFCYGYLHPWLRGVGPLGRSGCLFAVLWPLQVLLLLIDLTGPPGGVARVVCVLTAQHLLVALGLGLYWEVRMVRAAGLPWGHIRNFRSLSSLAVPTTTVLVAAVTAVATVLAGSWATSLTDQQDTSPTVVNNAPQSGPGP
ncbi:hypothetical protein [Streptomyces sulfonofaciens]|uniref:hypothetical protein n=1 Tax=Streptomyces sulfonofaciens TaxID=68272 RepID=UPI0016729A60|nr:hypothetical protein [Streptomyces sulfonofaciens]